MPPRCAPTGRPSSGWGLGLGGPTPAQAQAAKAKRLHAEKLGAQAEDVLAAEKLVEKAEAGVTCLSLLVA